MTWIQAPMIYSIALAEIFCGFVVNGFITVTQLKDWWGGRKMKPFDRLFLSLGLSRLFFMCFLIFNIINRAFSLNFYHIKVLNWMLNTVYLNLDFISLWFSMWLCVLYFIKVAIFKNILLIRIKLRISEMVPYMILSSVLISFVSAFVFAYNYEGTVDIMIPSPKTETNTSMDKQLLYLVPSYFFGHFLPFLLVSASSLFLVEVIFVHIRHLSSNITSFTTPSMDAHYSAIRSVITIEIMTIFNFLITVLFRFDFHDTCNKSILFLLAVSYPVLHSVVLIAGNAKLKKAAIGIIHHFKKRCEAGKSCSKSQVNICVDTILKQQQQKI